MSTIRRIYAYLLAFAGLSVLTLATASLGQILVDLMSGRAAGLESVRDDLSREAAGVVVGLPVWLLHWLWMERAARADESERASTLRRLYLYVVLASAMLVIAYSVREAIVNRAVRDLPFTLVALVVWLGHWRLVARDRELVGEVGGSATLRRWYIYGSGYVGLLTLLSGASGLVEWLWRTLTGLSGARWDEPLASTVVGLALWLVHWFVLPARLPQNARRDDSVSVLRSAYLFLSLGVGVAGTLIGASQLLYYVVARFLGVANPGGVGGNLLQAAAGPASVAIVYGAAWAYHGYALRRQATAYEEEPRQAGIRRLYTHLVSLIALAVFASGVAGLLWTSGDLVLAPASSGDTWRGNLALYATLVLVGLPVWLLHWQRGDVADAHSLARRLYLYLSLIGAMLALIGGAATVLYRLIGLLLGSGSTTKVLTDLVHALAVAIVAAAIAVYHWRVVRADSTRSQPAIPAEHAEVVVRIRADDHAMLERALAALRATDVDVTLLSGT